MVYRGWLPLAEESPPRIAPACRFSPWFDTLDVHQKAGAEFLAARSGAHLGDEMGLGKTRTALAGVRLAGCKRVLVICPAGIRTVWGSEVAALFQGDATVALPLPGDVIDKTAQFVVVAYSRLAAMSDELRRENFDACIIDEAQAIKNCSEISKRQNAEPDKLHRTEAAFVVARSIPRVYTVSGTPLLSRMREMFNLLSITRHPLGDSFYSFAKRYCDGHMSRFGFVANGISNPDEFRERIADWYLARTKAEVLPAMPPKKRVMRKIALSPSEMKDCQNHWRDYLEYLRAEFPLSRLRKALKGKHLSRLTELRSYLSAYKAEYAFKIAEAHPGKVVIIAAYGSSLKKLISLASKGSFVTYDGATTESNRAKNVAKFQTDPACRYFFGTAEPSKTGITLTAADLVITVDFLWTPADHAQIEDRAHRRGQTKPVTALYLHCPGTIDEQIVHLLAQKRMVIDAVLNGTPAPAEDDLAKEALIEAVLKSSDSLLAIPSR